MSDLNEDDDFGGYFVDDIGKWAAALTMFAPSSRFNFSLSCIEKWADYNGVLFNADKFQLLNVSVCKDEEVPDIFYGDKIITPSETVKYLGIIIDEDLSFAPHLEEVLSKVLKSSWRITNHVHFRVGVNPIPYLYI